MRVFIIHDWGGNPDKGWFLGLKEKLKALGHEFFIPTILNTNLE